ncbi:MAG: hypothetical protein DF280_01095 ['Brassica napus' phytoplasma]|nr:MAG: hypothetical protein DF280_01095 ['Brassica napus' phytoplasma]
MFKLKNQFSRINLFFISLGLLFLVNHHPVMAIENKKICNLNMKIHNIWIQKKEDIVSHVINKNIDQIFSYLTLDYPCYNSSTNNKNDLCWRIKEPPNNLLFVFFDSGIRSNEDEFYSLEDLNEMGNGAKNMYIFWLTKTLYPQIKTQKDIINKEIFYQLKIKLKNIEIEKLNIELNLFKEIKLQLEKEIDNQTNIYLNTKKNILNLENYINNLEEINKKNQNINLENEKLKQQLNLKYIELQKEKEKFLNQQNNINKLQQELNQKTTTYMGIFNSLYKKIF